MSPAIATLPLFAQQGHRRAAECLEHTRQAVEQSWPERAYNSIVATLGTIPQGTLISSEKLIDLTYILTSLEPAHDQRAFGSLFTKLARNGVIEKTGKTYQRTKGHGSPAFYWRVV